MTRVILFLILAAPFLCSGQIPLFHGGDNDGQNSSCFSQSNPSATISYFGGTNDGADQFCFEQNVVPVFGIFTGGLNDGQSNSCFLQNVASTAFLFMGGNNNFEFETCYEQLPESQNNLPFFGGPNFANLTFECFPQDPILATMFYGGNDLGTMYHCDVQPQPPGLSFFNGGQNDGVSNLCFIQGIVPAVTNHFSGGASNGPGISCFLQNAPSLAFLFDGGESNSSTNSCYLQSLPTIALLFHGGNSNLFPQACYQQTDYLIQPLPVELVSFTATCKENAVDLRWQTASEINSDYFLLERSEDLQSWDFVQKLTAAGNSFTPMNYQFIDLSPSRNIHYYRLKQVDYNGATNFSPIRSADCASSEKESLKAEIFVYPNPANEFVNIQISNFGSTNCSILLLSSQGQLIHQTEVDLEGGNGLFEIKRSTAIVSGMYFVYVRDFEKNATILHKKIIFL